MTIKIEQAENAVIVKINRPPVNALTPEMVSRLADWFGSYPGRHPVIITGTGDIFSAGVDTDVFRDQTDAERADFFNAITRMTAAIVSLRVPVVAALNGHALGGGLVLALCADFRIATEGDFKFGLTEAKAGVPFPHGPAEVIRSEIPSPFLRALTLSSRIASVDDMVAQAVFDDVTPPDSLMPAAMAYAAALAGQPAYKQVKRQVRGPLAARLQSLL